MRDDTVVDMDHVNQKKFSSLLSVSFNTTCNKKRQKISSTGIEPVTDGFQYLLQSTALPTELRRDLFLIWIIEDTGVIKQCIACEIKTNTRRFFDDIELDYYEPWKSIQVL